MNNYIDHLLILDEGVVDNIKAGARSASFTNSLDKLARMSDQSRNKSAIGKVGDYLKGKADVAKSFVQGYKANRDISKLANKIGNMPSLKLK